MDGEKQVYLPIGEMLDDLRCALEEFEENPNHETFEDVQIQLERIQQNVEDEIPDDAD